MSERTVIGLQPWLPWPLSAWRWWTEPVRAEYLAALRIGVAVVLLTDIFLTYLPQAEILFGADGIGSPELYDYLRRPGSWKWSLWPGFGDPLVSCCALLAWIAGTALLLLGFWARLASPEPAPAGLLAGAVLGWTVAAAFVVLGVWARTENERAPIDLLIPLAVLGLTGLFFGAELLRGRRYGRSDAVLRRALLLAGAVAAVLVGLGTWKVLDVAPGGPVPVRWAASRWHQDVAFLRGAIVVWAVATAGLLVGLGSRWCAVLVWLISFSFANVNSNIDNSGDTVRGIILFYLMLCPCGAAWSMDDWLARRFGTRRGVMFVSPWSLRLLFVQMIFIYWMNGLYKALGTDWPEGVSYYYVSCDLAVSRFSFSQFPLPFWVTWLMSELVFWWELTFPLWLPFRLTRIAALSLGALFHLGTFLQMELGGFGPYMLCLYLTLLPWDRWLNRAPRGFARTPAKPQAV